jgi:hypothetical protein
MRANDVPPSSVTAAYFAFLRWPTGVFSSVALFFPFFCDDRFDRFGFGHMLSFLVFVVCPADAPGKIDCNALLEILHNCHGLIRDTILLTVLAIFL